MRLPPRCPTLCLHGEGWAQEATEPLNSVWSVWQLPSFEAFVTVRNWAVS